MIFLSAIPIGVLMNVVRITVTVALYRVAGPDLANLIFHDVAGWVMMPMALLVLWLEMVWLSRLWTPEEETGPVPVAVPSHERGPVYPAFPTPIRREARGDYPLAPLVPSTSSSMEATAGLQEIPDAAP